MIRLKNILYFILILSIGACSKEDSPPSPPDGEEEAFLYKDGITRISDDSLAFVLFAPNKKEVYLIGDFNNWQKTEAFKMKKEGDRFRIRIGQLDAGKEYICQYLIDDQLRIADPYANKIADPTYDKEIPDRVYPGLLPYPAGKTTEIAMVVSTSNARYNWKIHDFITPQPENAVIYELLIRDFTEAGTINGAKEKLGYLKSLGIDAIELMPFNEFEGNNSWGYNPSFYFATDKAYGTSEDYKAFIDECHQKGIAVIMDIVLNHSYGQSPLVRMYQDKATLRPTAENPWYNTVSNFENPAAQWGYDFNHESTYTRQFVDSVCSFWMSEYKIDGFRFDFTKGFSNTPYKNSGETAWGNPYDAARIQNLKRIYGEIKKRKPDVWMICEHLSDNQEEKELSEYGLFLWGNINDGMNEATMGWTQQNSNGSWNSDISWGSYLQRGWNRPRLITYMESHDEERLMYKNEQYGKQVAGYNVKDIGTGLKRAEAAAVILLSLPGPKLIWQFGEVGYDYKLGRTAEEGRLDKKPVRWDYYEVPARKALSEVYATMLQLRKSHPIFTSTAYTASLAGPVKQIGLTSTQGNACVVANFDVVPVTASVPFGQMGQWLEYFTGKETNITSASLPMELQPGEYRLYLSK